MRAVLSVFYDGGQSGLRYHASTWGVLGLPYAIYFKKESYV